MERSIAAASGEQFPPVSGDLSYTLFRREPEDRIVDDWSLNCIAIIREFQELPGAVRTAKIARIEGRILNRRLLSLLISQVPPPGSKLGWSTRILKREESLRPHLGKMLSCVLIRLPGVQYTIEADVDARTVVHWEWQAI